LSGPAKAESGHFVPKQAPRAAQPLFQMSYGLRHGTEPGCWDKLSLRAEPLIPRKPL
jgi:hypothetical protein